MTFRSKFAAAGRRQSRALPRITSQVNYFTEVDVRVIIYRRVFRIPFRAESPANFPVQKRASNFNRRATRDERNNTTRYLLD